MASLKFALFWFVFMFLWFYLFQNGHGGVDLLTTNSSGDVFATRLKKSGFEEQDGVVERMKKYESHFEGSLPQEKTKSDLEFINMTYLLESCPQELAKQKKKPEFQWKYEDMYSPESLTFYRDVLARKILQVWAPEGGEEVKEEEAMSVDDKVREWMEKC